MKNCTHTHISELDAKSGSEAMCIFLSCICLPDSKPFYSFLISRLGSVCFQLVVSWHSFHWSWECLFFLLLSLFFSFSFLLKLLLLFFNVLSSGLCSDSAKNCRLVPGADSVHLHRAFLQPPESRLREGHRDTPGNANACCPWPLLCASLQLPKAAPVSRLTQHHHFVWRTKFFL